VKPTETPTERPTEKPNEQIGIKLTALAASIANLSIIKSTNRFRDMKGYSFRAWKYATVKTVFIPNRELSELCIDTGCNASVIDRSFLLTIIPDAKIKIMTKNMTLQGVGADRPSCADFVTLELYIPR
jgi:hypothetical protein